jgi:hypothetical protein
VQGTALDIHHRVRPGVVRDREPEEHGDRALPQQCDGTQIAYLYVNPTHALTLTAGKTFTSTTTVSPGVFHELEMSVTLAGAKSTTNVWLGGTLVAALSRTVTLPAAPIAQLQLGQVMSGGTDNVAFDDAAFDTAMLPSPHRRLTTRQSRP